MDSREQVARHASDGAFLAVAEAARVAIVTTDAQGRFTYANAAAERMLGVAREDLIGVSSTLYVAPTERARFVEGLGKFLAGKGRIAAGDPVAFTGRRHSGEEFPAEISLSWFDGAAGRYVTGVIVDLSDRHRAEVALRQAREQAEQAARSKSDFLAVMSHELRTPMHGVLGMATLLSSTALTDEQREYLDMIARSGHALLAPDRRHPRLLEDRGRARGARTGALRHRRHRQGSRHAARRAGAREGPPHRRARGRRHADAPGDRSRASAPGAVQPRRQCDQVHRDRLGGRDRGTRGRAGDARHAARDRGRHGDRYPRRDAAPAVREVHAGRCLDDAAVRWHGPGPGDLEGTRRESRRDDRRVEHGRRGVAVLVHA